MLSNDKKVLKGLLKKNRLIIEEFVESNFNKLLVFVKDYGGTVEDAEDLMQDALIVLYNTVKNEETEIERNLNLYFCGIYRKLWFMLIRRKTKQSYIYDNEIIENPCLMPEEEMLQEIKKNERYKLYKKHYYKLDKLCKNIFKMLNNGIHVMEIANELNYRKKYIYKKKTLCKQELLERIMKDPMYEKLRIKN